MKYCSSFQRRACLDKHYTFEIHFPSRILTTIQSSSLCCRPATFVCFQATDILNLGGRVACPGQLSKAAQTRSGISREHCPSVKLEGKAWYTLKLKVYERSWKIIIFYVSSYIYSLSKCDFAELHWSNLVWRSDGIGINSWGNSLWISIWIFLSLK